jgi:hypothetical protein
MKISHLLSIAAVAVSFVLNAQKPFEGKIVYKIDYPTLPDEMRGMEGMLPKETVVYAKGSKSRSETPSLMGNQVVISDAKKDYGVVLMDMMGQKMAIEPTAEDMKDAKVRNEKMKIEYLNETKTVAGIKCKKAIITAEDEEFPLVVFYTEEFSNYNASDMKQLKGMPLEYTMKANGMEMRMVAQSVTPEKVDDKKFEVPADYQKMTSKDLEKMFGQ